MVIVAVDADQRGSVSLGVQNLRRFEVRRDQNVSLQAETRGSRGDCVGQVAGRGAADGIESEGLGVGQSYGNHAVLEAQGGQTDGVVLEIEIVGADPTRQAR